MATPEVRLPPPPQEPLQESPPDSDDSKNVSAVQDPSGKPGLANEVPPYSRTLDETPIVFHYLSFDTELPPPSLRSHASHVSEDLGPPPPDLRNYVSPFTWSESRKTITTWLSCFVTVLTAYTAGAYSPAAEQMMSQWNVGRTAIYVGITTFTTGFATAPMILAPFSELNGRKPVFIATGVLFVICQLCCAVTRSFPGMLLARFFAGVGGSTFSTMVG
ncbi:MAG: hypothetical protein Q9183_005660, partial [Haloplaca sp. 2 TL-2023]